MPAHSMARCASQSLTRLPATRATDRRVDPKLERFVSLKINLLAPGGRLDLPHWLGYCIDHGMLLAAKTGHRGRYIASLAGFVGVSLAAGAIGSLATAPRIPTWYASLIKPPLDPPNWLFAPVWTTLYVLMGVAAWLVWKKAGTIHERAFSWFWIQLVLNTAWSLVFFGSEQPGWGFPSLSCSG